MNHGHCFAPATAPLAVLLRECHFYNRLHDIIGILRYTPEGRFLQVLEGSKSLFGCCTTTASCRTPTIITARCSAKGRGRCTALLPGRWDSATPSPTTCAPCSVRRPPTATASYPAFTPHSPSGNDSRFCGAGPAPQLAGAPEKELCCRSPVVPGALAQCKKPNTARGCPYCGRYHSARAVVGQELTEIPVLWDGPTSLFFSGLCCSTLSLSLFCRPSP